jgi:hypothetical protein
MEPSPNSPSRGVCIETFGHAATTAVSVASVSAAFAAGLLESAHHHSTGTAPRGADGKQQEEEEEDGIGVEGGEIDEKTNPQTNSNNNPPEQPKPQHIMISYAWGAKKSLVIALTAALHSLGHEVWRDEEGSAIVPKMVKPLFYYFFFPPKPRN